MLEKIAKLMFESKDFDMSTDNNYVAPKFVDALSFSLEVEQRYFNNKGNITYFDLILEYAEELNIAYEQVNKLLSKSLKDKLTVECMDNNMLKIKRTSFVV